MREVRQFQAFSFIIINVVVRLPPRTIINFNTCNSQRKRRSFSHWSWLRDSELSQQCEQGWDSNPSQARAETSVKRLNGKRLDMSNIGISLHCNIAQKHYVCLIFCLFRLFRLNCLHQMTDDYYLEWSRGTKFSLNCLEQQLMYWLARKRYQLIDIRVHPINFFVQIYNFQILMLFFIFFILQRIFLFLINFLQC